MAEQVGHLVVVAWQEVHLVVGCWPLRKDGPQHQGVAHQVDLVEVGLAPLGVAETALVVPEAQTSHWWCWMQLREAEMAVALHQNVEVGIMCGLLVR